MNSQNEDEGSELQMQLTRVRCLPEGGASTEGGASAADCLHFTPDSGRLIIATRTGAVHVWKLDVLSPTLVKVLDEPPSKLKVNFLDYFRLSVQSELTRRTVVCRICI